MDLSNIHTPPWRDGAQLTLSPGANFGADLLARVGAIPSAIAPELAMRGIVGIDISNSSRCLLEAAFGRILQLSELAAVVHAAVEHIHLLQAEAGYDVSHSEPQWRSSIFVSLPESQDEIGELRLAESIVHEAMHLQLTNREQHIDLVAGCDGAMRSPWRDGPRTYRGVLHGLYVFSCISYFFRALILQDIVAAAGRVHVTRRLSDIAQELRSIDVAELGGGLTSVGNALVEKCMSTLIDPFPASDQIGRITSREATRRL